jgi:hypothetical protein
VELIGILIAIVLLLTVSLAVLIAFKSIFVWPGEYKKRAAENEKRLLNPDILGVSKQLGTSLPDALLQLHRDRQQLLQRHFEIVSPTGERFSVEWWLPLDIEMLKDDLLPKQGLLIAEYDAWGDGAGGGVYYVDLSEHPVDPPVYLLSYDQMRSESVAAKLSEFLGWSRQPRPSRV